MKVSVCEFESTLYIELIFLYFRRSDSQSLFPLSHIWPKCESLAQFTRIWCGAILLLAQLATNGGVAFVSSCLTAAGSAGLLPLLAIEWARKMGATWRQSAWFSHFCHTRASCKANLARLASLEFSCSDLHSFQGEPILCSRPVWSIAWAY